MIRSRYIIFLFVSLFGLYSCKSEFEKIRTSNDPDSMYKSAVEYFEKGEYSKTQTLFESIVSSFRGKKEFEQLNYMFAYTYYHQKDYSAAASAFKNFANTFVYSPFKEEMEYMHAYSLYLQSPNFRLDQQPSLEANDALQTFVNTYPTSERAKECQKLLLNLRKKLEEKAFAQGEQYFSNEIANQLARNWANRDKASSSPFEALSRREMQMTEMIVDGKGNQDIADTMGVALTTLSTYRSRIYSKLNIDNDVKLTHLAMRFGVAKKE